MLIISSTYRLLYSYAFLIYREITIQKDMEATSRYLSLQELGLKLRVISEQLPPSRYIVPSS